MPPKKNDSKKAAEKAKAKVVADKTFGLKNKNKSAKVQKFVEEVKKQAAGPAQRKRQEDSGPLEKGTRGAKEGRARRTLQADPGRSKRSRLAPTPRPYCTKCKFSHDVNVERKGAKIDLYTDKRKEQENDTMDKWDQSKLESVIKSKHGNPRTTTDIVCKYFLEAIENAKYGWFWVCPNGGDTCKYKHALPPGYVLKAKDAKKNDDDEEKISLEEFLESERHKLGSNLTPVTYETFMEWKRKRLEKQAADEAEKNKAKEAAVKAGRKQGLSGRDLFTFAAPEEDEDDGGTGDNDFDLAQFMQANADADNKAADLARRQADLALQQAGSSSADEPPIAPVDDVDESLFEGEDLEQLQLEDAE
ncbi:hypothetical protein AMAG_14706 [Allomyces macrogynus ATCC 38327]|uniref:C3H1-type domain-containing protein n=1 Tax=Allomyces macrogynus (strain ATCC 38327) TaxID=578462 RepID=A0A0L0T779_ALLM3|nr:hypothetical protein AMAG_14706 [Allomyces macrogynus ATCC 38327]|eukprot:KNE70580.1 hypothetical protein AMAG_14706 [Allomyces macrogynus ATCC 38327]